MRRVAPVETGLAKPDLLGRGVPLLEPGPRWLCFSSLVLSDVARWKQHKFPNPDRESTGHLFWGFGSIGLGESDLPIETVVTQGVSRDPLNPKPYTPLASFDMCRSDLSLTALSKVILL